MGSTDNGLSIKQNMLWNSMGSLVNLGCQWLITVLIARMSNNYQAAGVYALATSVYTMFSAVGHYRMYTYQVSDVHHENSTGEYLTLRAVTCSIALTLCAAYGAVTCPVYALPAILLYALNRAIALMVDVLHACDQCNHRMDYIGQSLALQGVLSLVIFASVFGATGNLEITLLSMTVAIVLVGIVFDYPRTCQFGRIEWGISLKKVTKLLMSCLPVVLAAIAISSAPSIPRQYLSSNFGDEALGIYASVAAPVAIIQTGASYIYNPLLGYFSESYAARDRRRFFSLFARCSVAMAGVCLVCALGVMVFGETLLSLVFGEQLAEFAYLLAPLVLLAIVTGYLWFLNDLLMALRNFKGSFLGSVAALALSLLSLPVILQLGSNGVTVVCLLSSAAGIVVMLLCLAIQLVGYWNDHIWDGGRS